MAGKGMAMARFSSWVLGALTLAALNGCGSSSPVAGGGGGSSSGGAPVTRYDLANRCFALKAADAYAVHNADGSYAASSATLAGGEPLYLKPTALGRYLAYARDKSMLAASGGN